MRKQCFHSVFAVCAVIIAAGLCLPFASCGTENSPAESLPKAQGRLPDLYEDDDVWYCNRFLPDVSPSFVLPEAEAAEDADPDGRLTYTGVSGEQFDAYLSSLVSDGFSHVHMKYSDFFLRDDCILFVNYDEEIGRLHLSWYQKSPYAPQNGLSADEAASLLMPDREDSLSPIRLFPIDVTPKGFYERTGGQVFAYPFYSYDRFRNEGKAELMFEDNEWYAGSVAVVKGTTSYGTMMEKIGVCDLDGDGSDDLLLLWYGPTSGVFSFYVICVTGNGVYEHLFVKNYQDLRFSHQNGRIVLLGVGYDGAIHDYDIQLSEKDGVKTVKLTENGRTVKQFGSSD